MGLFGGAGTRANGTDRSPVRRRTGEYPQRTIAVASAVALSHWADPSLIVDGLELSPATLFGDLLSGGRLDSGRPNAGLRPTGGRLPGSWRAEDGMGAPAGT